MWNFASKAFTGASGLKTDSVRKGQVSSECSDDEPSLNNSREDRLECPICWESFNIVENVPYVLWCGHTLCKNCVLGLQRAVVKFPTLPIHLPFFVSCPWCNLLSLRLVYKGNVKFPSKNYFLLWMVESMNGDRSKSHSCFQAGHPPTCSISRTVEGGNQLRHANSRRSSCSSHHSEHSESSYHEGRLVTSFFSAGRLQLSLRKSLVFFFQLIAKFPLIVIFLLMVLYAIPASATILAVYMLITIVFAVPSFLILYFALPSLDWLVREIIN
ncbi:Zinc finger, RING/FYVE/PHD-type [Corchorus olitorius]|uniref:Zinc finger, RING/FYVE/PHD-type n=1 Tax=Corchorus olitorius TaxID=93759 RepID=A0A1R3G4K1_9ROSI|nr:Zinc finger, RING/FYVE/PHD-type [Corchorus olitorius]